MIVTSEKSWRPSIHGGHDTENDGVLGAQMLPSREDEKEKRHEDREEIAPR